MRALLLLLACLLALALSVLPEAEGCSFPHYLTRRPRWESRITLNRRRTDVYWKFHERSVELIDLTTLNMDSQVHECVLEMPGQKYVLQTEGATGQPSYTCVKFNLRSEQIVQVHRSASATSLDAVELCDDAGLELDPWPLIWPQVGETYHTCPLLGGYDFTIEDHREQDVLCENAQLKPRMESECMTGEGLTLDFRNFECRGRIEMQIKQSLVCLGSWTDTRYSYTVMTDNDDLWPKLWLLRYPIRHGKDFTAQLYDNIMVDDSDSSQSKDYIDLKLRQALYPSLCENEAYPCNDCDGSTDYYCQKSCHRCDSLQDVSTCEFDTRSRGEWMEVSHHGHRDITITTSLIYADDLLPLQCFDLHTEAWFEGKNYKALATLFKNGCKPRYTCVEFERATSSILRYRLSQNLVWPHTMTLTGKDICEEAQFADDPSPLEGEFRSKHLKALVKKTTLNRLRPTRDCDLQGKFLLQASYDHGARNCTAYLDTCQSSHSFAVKTDTSCTGTVVLETHRCLASFREDHSHLVITEKSEPDGESYCWAFHKDEWESTYRVYLLYASDCHEDIGQKIKYYGYQGHLGEFTMTPGEGYLGSHSCQHQFTSPAAEEPSSTLREWTSPLQEVHHSMASASYSAVSMSSTMSTRAVPTSALFRQSTASSQSASPKLSSSTATAPERQTPDGTRAAAGAKSTVTAPTRTTSKPSTTTTSKTEAAYSTKGSTTTQKDSNYLGISKPQPPFEENQGKPVAKASTSSGNNVIAATMLLGFVTIVTWALI